MATEKSSAVLELVHEGKKFGLVVVTNETSLIRVIIHDAGLEYPYTNYEKAADFLVDEYGGTKEDVIALLDATYPLGKIKDGKNTKMTTGSKGGSKGKPKDGEKADKNTSNAAKVDKPSTDKVKVEKTERTFDIPGGEVKRTVQVHTVAEGAIVEQVEDVDLNESIKLHIDIYSKKSRICTVTEKDAEGKVVTLIAGVSLMDAIYVFAEKAGMTFSQADKHIKIKRGLITPKVKAPVDPPAPVWKEGDPVPEGNTAPKDASKATEEEIKK